MLATLEQALVIRSLRKLSQRDGQTLREILGKIIGWRLELVEDLVSAAGRVSAQTRHL